MLALLTCGAGVLQAQQPKAGPYRKLAPGVVTKVEPAAQFQETFSRHDILGLIDVNPDYEVGQERCLPPRHLVAGVPLQGRCG